MRFSILNLILLTGLVAMHICFPVTFYIGMCLGIVLLSLFVLFAIPAILTSAVEDGRLKIETNPYIKFIGNGIVYCIVYSVLLFLIFVVVNVYVQNFADPPWNYAWPRM